jgi:cystathionine beta-lyase
MRLGYGVGANDAELVLRSLPTMDMRYKAQDASCRQVAAWCLQQPAFAQVLHPAVATSPGHVHWRDLCAQAQAVDAPVHPGGAAASLLGLRFHPRFKQSQVDDFCNRLALFKLAFSWAGPISLVVPYELKSMRQMAKPALLEGGYVRLSIGLENPQDLIDDLAQALELFHQPN